MTRLVPSFARAALARGRRPRQPNAGRRWVAPRVGVVVALLLAALVMAAGSQRAEGQTAPPIFGQYRAIRVANNDDSSELFGTAALCRPGDWVLGGGAAAYGDTLAIDQRLSLGQMRPFGAPRPGDGRHGFEAYAQEIPPGTAEEWVLLVYAVCAAEKPPGHEIVVTPPSEESSSSVKETVASCGPGRVALGAGARIEHNVSQPDPLAAGLHVVRPSGPGDITRATAKEWPGGYSGTWRLRGYAVCANAPRGYEVRHTDTTGRTAAVPCTGDKHILGAGAVADAPITEMVPNHGSVGTGVLAPRNGASSGFIAAYATCADTAPPPPTPPPPPCPPQPPDCE